MAIPKKGMRKIECKGKVYGWIIRSKPTYGQAAFQTPMTIGIQDLECENPKVLHVTLNIDRPDNWISNYETHITPSIVRNIIKAARNDGWESNSGGLAFKYKYGVIKHT